MCRCACMPVIAVARAAWCCDILDVSARTLDICKNESAEGTLVGCDQKADKRTLRVCMDDMRCECLVGSETSFTYFACVGAIALEGEQTKILEVFSVWRRR